MRPCCIDQVIARSMWQGQGLGFSCKDWMLEVNKLFIIWLFALFLRCHGHYRENNDLKLANQSMHYIGYKDKPNNN